MASIWPSLKSAHLGLGRIERLDWKAAETFECYGLQIGVKVSKRGVLGELRAFFPPGWSRSSSVLVDRLYSVRIGAADRSQFHLLYANGKRIARSRTLKAIFDWFESDLHHFVAEANEGRVFVHAGVVGWKGRAIVLPGRSYSGKSTLVAELVRQGATYYSDEFAVLDSLGRVHPWARQLAIRENGAAGKGTRYPVEAFGGKAGTRPLPIALIVAFLYQRGAGCRLARLSPGGGVMALLEHTVAIRQKPDLALPILRLVASRVPCFEGVRGEAKGTAGTLLHDFGSLVIQE